MLRQGRWWYGRRETLGGHIAALRCFQLELAGISSYSTMCQFQVFHLQGSETWQWDGCQSQSYPSNSKEFQWLDSQYRDASLSFEIDPLFHHCSAARLSSPTSTCSLVALSEQLVTQPFRFISWSGSKRRDWLIQWSLPEANCWKDQSR